jgi:hypothetical protein
MIVEVLNNKIQINEEAKVEWNLLILYIINFLFYYIIIFEIFNIF